MDPLEQFEGEKYLLLTTYRKDGRPVHTPVWFVRDGDALGAWTASDAGKVKRIRRAGDVTLAPCDMRGNPHGTPVNGRATLTDAAGTARILNLLKRKYGLVGRLALLGSRLRRGAAGAAGIRITVGP